LLPATHPKGDALKIFDQFLVAITSSLHRDAAFGIVKVVEGDP
jgi:hypothetical protein